MRRAIRQAHKLGFKGQFMQEIAKVVIEKLGHVYPNLVSQKDVILNEIDIEEKQFLTTLEKGLREFEKLLR
jgi:alanyl-tRNA synthetase